MKQKSRLAGELGIAVDNALSDAEEILFELKTYRGYGLVLTGESLLLVVGGVLAGLKRHEQHVERMGFDEIEDITIKPQTFGCLNIFGIPPSDLEILPKDRTKHSEKWSTLAVDYHKLGEAVRIVAHVKVQIALGELKGKAAG